MPYRRAEGAVYEVVEEKAMLVDLAGKEIITLNKVGTLIWDALPEYAEPGAMAAHLVGNFQGVSEGELENDIRGFLDELVGLGLVTVEV